MVGERIKKKSQARGDKKKKKTHRKGRKLGRNPKGAPHPAPARTRTLEHPRDPDRTPEGRGGGSSPLSTKAASQASPSPTRREGDFRVPTPGRAQLGSKPPTPGSPAPRGPILPPRPNSPSWRGSRRPAQPPWWQGGRSQQLPRLLSDRGGSRSGGVSETRRFLKPEARRLRHGAGPAPSPRPRPRIGRLSLVEKGEGAWLNLPRGVAMGSWAGLSLLGAGVGGGANPPGLVS